jgi:integrase
MTKESMAAQPIKDKAQLEEMKIYLKKRSLRNYIVFMVGINTGLRINDILSLKVKDIKKGTHIELNGRYVLMNKPLQDIMNPYLDGKKSDEYLFKSREGENKPVQRSMIYRALKEAAEHVGLKSIGASSMRKTFGYHLYAQTQDIRLVKAVLNYPHSVANLIEYLRVSEVVLERTMNDFSL